MDYVTRQFIFLAKKFRKELRKTQESLHRDLTRLSDRLKDLKNAVTAHGQPDHKSDNTPPITVSDFRTQVPIRVQTEPQRSTPERIWRIIKGALEVLVGVAVIAYTVISYQNWQEQITATNFAGIQARRAREALNESVKNFRTDERSWIVASFEPKGSSAFTPPGPPTTENSVIGFMIQNRGKTPANNIDGAVVFGVLYKNERFDFSDHVHGMPIKLGTLAPEPAAQPSDWGVPLTKKLPSGRRGSILWSEESREQVVAGDAVILGYGKISYNDIFSRRIHFVTFCRVLVANLRTKVPSTGIVQQPPIYTSCANANGIDND